MTVEKAPLNGDRPTVSVTQMSPDDDGNIKIVVANPDPVIGTDNTNVAVTVRVDRATGNTHRLVDNLHTKAVDDTADSDDDDANGDLHTATKMRRDKDGKLEADPAYDEPRLIGVTAPQEMFADDPPAPIFNHAAKRNWRMLSSNLNRNTVSVTVFDQYGKPYKNGSVVTATFGSRADEDTDTRTDSGTSDRGGRVHFSYNYGEGDHPSIEDVGITQYFGLDNTMVKVYWAEIGPRGEGTGPLLLPDASKSALIVNPTEAPAVDLPVAYLFGADDEFVVGQGDTTTSPRLAEPALLSLEQFLEVLMVAISSDPRIGIYDADGPIADLTWAGFNNNRPTDSATWELTGLHCNPPPGGDREPALADPPNNN